MKEKIIVLVGPTASGKTNMGVQIAKKINGEIISADSMQIYKHMDIGTAKPTIQEMDTVPHYCINEVEPHEEFSVAVFRDRSEKYIQDILIRGKMPIVVGGTGLYVNAITKPWNFSKTEPNEKLRLELERVVQEKGNQHLHEMLRDIDPDSAHAIHPNNVKRVIRALEVYKTSGKTKSELDRESMENDLAYEPILIGLAMDRTTLYERIELRIDLMLQAGLVQEVKGLLESGYHESLVSMQGLGYKEIVKYLKGEYSLEQAVEILKRDTRHFAKRQLTWFRKDERIKWFEIDKYQTPADCEADILNKVVSQISRGRCPQRPVI